MDEKNATRAMYGFDNDQSFAEFYQGIVEAYSGDTKKAAKHFEDSIKENSDNPHSHKYLVMMYEFSGEPVQKIKKACEDWLKAAKKSNNEKEIRRAQYSIDYYNADEEGKLKMTEMLKKSMRGRIKDIGKEGKHA